MTSASILTDRNGRLLADTGAVGFNRADGEEAHVPGLARTLQVTICTPLDFTEYHKECIREGVTTEDYDDHDMFEGS